MTHHKVLVKRESFSLSHRSLFLVNRIPASAAGERNALYETKDRGLPHRLFIEVIFERIGSISLCVCATVLCSLFRCQTCCHSYRPRVSSESSSCAIVFRGQESKSKRNIQKSGECALSPLCCMPRCGKRTHIPTLQYCTTSEDQDFRGLEHGFPAFSIPFALFPIPFSSFIFNLFPSLL